MERLSAYAWVLAILVIGAFPAVAGAAWRRAAIGEIDCNGLSPIQTPVASDRRVRRPARRTAAETAFDEQRSLHRPRRAGSVSFISNAPGSGNDVTFVERLGTGSAQALPTTSNPGNDVHALLRAHGGAVAVARRSATRTRLRCCPCTPELRLERAACASVIGSGAGAAFVELQFYAARIRAVRRQHQLRRHALVLGAERSTASSAAPDGIDVQPQLRGAGRTSRSSSATAFRPGRPALS